MIRLAIRVRSADAEIVLAELLELAPNGVEEVELDDGRVEYAAYGWPGELPEIPDVRAAAGDALIEVSSGDVADDWGERWKRFHRPVLIESPAPELAPALRVCPPWKMYDQHAARDETLEIVIDPGRAFGTGSHATTELCLRLLLELAAHHPERGALLDVGTGSGVLAIAAARLGYEPVIAVDNDPASLEAAAQNASVNGVSLDVRRLDVRTEAIPWPGQAPGEPVTIVANLVRPLLLDLVRTLPALPAGSNLIASGLLVGEADEIVEAYAGQGLQEHERREQGEWAAVWLRLDERAVEGGRA